MGKVSAARKGGDEYARPHDSDCQQCRTAVGSSPLHKKVRHALNQPYPGASTLGPGRHTSDLLFTGCLETHNRHPPKTSGHLMTHSNSQSKEAQNTLTEIML